jgi:hypothetical protein
MEMIPTNSAMGGEMVWVIQSQAWLQIVWCNIRMGKTSILGLLQLIGAIELILW